MEPSKDWAEVVGDDEKDRHAAFAGTLVEIQSGTDAKHGTGRALHRKQVLGVSIEFDVLDGLPGYAKFGIFATPASFTGLARLSNGAIAPASDAVPDIRGFAFSLRDGIAGPGALGFDTDRQDFAMINRQELGFHDSKDFMQIVPAAAKGQAALLKKLVDMHGKVGGPKEAVRLSREQFKGFSGFATEPFFSAAPIKIGPYAAKVRIVPRQSSKHLSARLDFTKDMTARLVDGPVIYDMALQFYVSEELTPIEDGLIHWSEEESPWIPVGVLTIPQQNPASAEGIELAARIEIDRFDPWSALEDHRPLGEIMRARGAAYFPSQKHRGATGA